MSAPRPTITYERAIVEIDVYRHPDDGGGLTERAARQVADGHVRARYGHCYYAGIERIRYDRVRLRYEL